MKVEYEKFDYYPLPVFKNDELIERAKIGFPAPYLGTSLLACYAGIMGSRFRLKIRDTYKFANLYAANIGQSGSYKSPSMGIFTNQIRELNSMTWREFDIYNDSYPDKKKDFNDRQFMIAGGTQEGITRLMSLNTEGVFSVYDELSSFFNSMNMYRAKARGNDLEFYTNLYDGENIPTVLKNQTNYVIKANSVLTILGNTTFDSLHNIFENRTDNGFKERFIFATIPERKLKRIPENDYRIRTFDEHFKHLFMQYRTYTPEGSLREYFVDIPFPEKYEEIFFDWYDAMCDTQLVNQGAYLSKTKRFFWKFCLILAVIYGEIKVTKEIAENSIKLLQYYYSTYNLLFGLDKEDPLSKLTDIQRKMWDALPNMFSYGEGLKIIKEKRIASERTYGLLLKKDSIFRKSEMGYEKIA